MNHSHILRWLWFYLAIYIAFILAMFLGICLSDDKTACTSGDFFAVGNCFVIFSKRICDPAAFWGYTAALFVIGIGIGMGAVLVEAAFAATVSYKNHSTERLYRARPLVAYASLMVTILVTGLLYFFYITVALTNVVFFTSASLGAFCAVAAGVAPVFLYDVRLSPDYGSQPLLRPIYCQVIVNKVMYDAVLTKTA